MLCIAEPLDNIRGDISGILSHCVGSVSLWKTGIVAILAKSNVTNFVLSVDWFVLPKQIRFIVSDANAHIVNTWAQSTQNLTHVMNAMAMVGIPPNSPQSADFSVIHGLRAAVEAISELTDQQKDEIAAEESAPNYGRVICITSARDNSSMSSLEDIFSSVIEQQNVQALANTQNFAPIDQCHLVIINLFPSTIESMVSNRDLQEVNA